MLVNGRMELAGRIPAVQKAIQVRRRVECMFKATTASFL